MPIDAVIFDADGTLVDSEPLGFEAILEEARLLGIPFNTEVDMLALKGQSMATCMAVLEQRLGRALPKDFEATLRGRMADNFRKRLQPMPGALAMLEKLHVPCCVASNGPLHKLQLTLTLTGLLPYFHGRVYSAYEVGSFKPEPGLFLHAAKEMGVPPDRCAVVEDSLPGVQAGLAAGMSVYALRSDQPLPDEFHARVTHLESLSDLLKTISMTH